MRKTICLSSFLIFSALHGFSQNTPNAEAFTVNKRPRTYGPSITPLLKNQTSLAWKQDELRTEIFKNIKNEKELFSLQATTRRKLLAMMGGLPEEKTSLNVQALGRIQMDGFHIEKLVFESLPGFHVPALVYVPENGGAKHPAVLVACGHSPIGKIYYQALCQRLVRRGYLVICWDPVGEGERSQFWNKETSASRYNLVCGEHAVLGNLAYLAGANLIRWEIWDGIRALDYLLTRPDVDGNRISITGTSGGGVQAAFIGALDERIKVVVPSCYISSLPMRASNRIFADPDSDPEQDLDGMISEGVDHAGLLLLVYPRPLLIASAVLDFFPIEGARKTFREISELYSRFQLKDRVAMVEGYHKHQFSLENQEAALNFLDRFNKMPLREGLPPVSEVDAKKLLCTQTGQVLLEYPNGKNLTDLIKEYFLAHLNKDVPSVSSRYYGTGYPNIKNWTISEHKAQPEDQNIGWQKKAHYQSGGLQIDHYLLHHSNDLEIPILYFHSDKNPADKILIWINLTGKASEKDWTQIANLVEKGDNVISFDFRGTGETRMMFEATSADDLKFAVMDSTKVYFNPLSGVFANYVYNALLTGRPYFLQMIEDTEIVSRFIQSHLKVKEIKITATPEAKILVREIVDTLPYIKAKSKEDVNGLKWSEIINQEMELWPIHNLLPGGAYIR
ncbi:MAG TPA: acetylxylan esterase [Chryseolinea sp.]|nr:acetylxylan esterase [Chryseolinea sp.]